MAKGLPQRGDAPGARVVDPSIAEAKAKAKALEAYWAKEGEKEVARHRAVQTKEYARVLDLVQRAEGLLSRPLRLEHERVLWFLLRMDNSRAWLPPADWGRPFGGKVSEPKATALRTLIMVETIRGYVPDADARRLHEEVKAAEPWKHRAGPRSSASIAPEAWVFALLLESAGAAWDARLFDLVFEMVTHAKRPGPVPRRSGGQRAQAVRQALKPRDRTTGEERLAFARRMARLWYVRDVWGFEARIRARRGISARVAPQILT
jgi:hypothetical protein